MTGPVPRPPSRAPWRLLFVIAAIALHGSTAGAPTESADSVGNASVRIMPNPAIDTVMPTVSGNQIAEIPLNRLSDTRNRPLFSPSRRPPVPPAPPATAVRVERAPEPLALPSPPGLALFGIVVGAQGARAFIATGAANRIIAVRTGDDVSGWTVTAITQRDLVLSRAEQSKTFTLFSPDNVSQVRRTDAAANPQAKRSTDPPRGRVRIR
jgi:general secretion pathway protein N